MTGLPAKVVTNHSALKWRVDDRKFTGIAQTADRSEALTGRCLRWFAARAVETLAVEEPLEIRLGGRRFTLTMRTPGHDEELVGGFLLAEGFIKAREELGEIRRVIAHDGNTEPNIVDIILNVPAAGLRDRLKRNFAISSSCGLCGRTSIESLRRWIAPIESSVRFDASALCQMALEMRGGQEVFAATGALHAAALFDESGNLRFLHEDVGRHNAVDKVIGCALFNDMIPLDRSLLMVSGRMSFEIVQKAGVAGIPIVAAVSAPSSLAVELAEKLGITLVGFLRDSGLNVYSYLERVVG